jgi:hypothetical protein
VLAGLTKPLVTIPVKRAVSCLQRTVVAELSEVACDRSGRTDISVVPLVSALNRTKLKQEEKVVQDF